MALRYPKASQPQGCRQVTQQGSRDLTAHQPRILLKRPAIVKRGAPEPFIKGIFEQKAEEVPRGRCRAQFRLSPLTLEMRHDRCGVGEPSPLRGQELRHLRHPGLSRASLEVVHVHFDELKPNPLGAQIGFELAGEVGQL